VQDWAGRWLRAALASASVIVVVAGLRAGVTLLVPILLAAFLAAVLFPFVAWLERRRVPRGLAVVATILLMLAAFTGPGLVVNDAAQTFAAAAPQYRAGFERNVGPVLERVALLGYSDLDWRALVDPGALLNLVRSLSAGVANVLGNAFVILITTAFMLLEAGNVRARLQHAFGLESSHLGGLDEALADVQHYLRLKTAISLATGTFIGLWLLALGVEYPILWGLLAFLLNFIPNFGSLMAALPPALLVLIQDGPGGRFLMVVLAYVIVNLVVGSILEPRIMGRSLGLSPLVVRLSLLFWGWVWGGVGLLLAVPLTMVVKLLLEHSDARWLATLLGPGTRRTRGATDG
jgi:predicted PurR-regulated permease PerM